MKKRNIIGLNVLFVVGIFFVLMGLYSLSSNITMRETIGEITHCSRVYNTYRDSNYWNASAKFLVDGKEYSGPINVNSHKYVGQKIKILYNPKRPDNFISKSSTYSGFIMIIFGFIFMIPKLKKQLKNN